VGGGSTFLNPSGSSQRPAKLRRPSSFRTQSDARRRIALYPDLPEVPNALLLRIAQRFESVRGDGVTWPTPPCLSRALQILSLRIASGAVSVGWFPDLGRYRKAGIGYRSKGGQAR
jgi:hypothetical protein